MKKELEAKLISAALKYGKAQQLAYQTKTLDLRKKFIRAEIAMGMVAIELYKREQMRESHRGKKTPRKGRVA